MHRMGGFLVSILALTVLVEVGGVACGAGDDGELRVTLTLVSNPRSTLSFKAEVETTWDCQVELEMWSQQTPVQRTWQSPSGRDHGIWLVGMRPNTTYTVRAVALVDGVEVGASEEQQVTTGALPPEILPFSVDVSDASRVSPGVTIFVPIESPFDFFADTLTYVGVDAEGFVVWYYQTPIDTPKVNPIARMLPDGTLLVGIYHGFRNISIAGETLWEVTSDDVGIGGFHHDAWLMPGGNLLVIGGERREIQVEELGGAVNVDTDTIYEVTREGEVVWQWDYLEHMGDQRFPGPLSRTPNMGGAYEVTHSNAVTYLPEDDAVLLSVRNQSWILKIHRQTSQVLWVLGPGGDFSLVSEDASGLDTWFFSQHAPELGPDGTVLVYDNGNDRPPPEAPRFSRAVQYRLDTERMEAEAQWQYVTDVYTPFLGDANLLEGGNVLVCVGGVGTDGQTPAEIVEVTGDASPAEVWRLSYPEHIIYRAVRVPSLYTPRP